MRPIHVEVVCVGTELLTGRVNTHVSKLGPLLNKHGLHINRECSVSDDPKTMVDVFSDAFRRSDIVLCAGGLGPTFDDITRDVWARVLKRPLRLYSFLVDEIREKFRSRGIRMPPANKRQGYILKGADVIPNLNGTAPGQYLNVGKKTLILLPGPGRELFPMVTRYVIPRLQQDRPLPVTASYSFHMVGVPESKIDQLVRPLVSRYKNVKDSNVTYGILASESIITVKYSVVGTNKIKVAAASENLKRKIRKILKKFIFGEDTDTLPGVVGQALLNKKRRLAVAESCTGGMIAKMITDQPGASLYFLEGVTTYNNASKINRLGVKPGTLKRFGAVSSAVAKEMAVGLKKKAKVDYALSVTGIAGPDGGTIEKPVGLVYIGCATPKGTRVKKFQFKGDRAWVRHRAALMALHLLYKELHT